MNRVENAFNFNKILETCRNEAAVLDVSENELVKKLNELKVAGLLQCSEEKILFSNDQLFNLYSASPALAFTLAQHLSAVERLFECTDWQNKNSKIWESVKMAKETVGLSTTYLAKSDQLPIKGILKEGNFHLSGFLPWVTGFGIFTYLILSFETESEIVTAMIPFSELNADSIKITKWHLVAYMSSNTVKIEINHLVIRREQLISKRLKNATLSKKRNTRFRFSELGIANGAIIEIEKMIENEQSHKAEILRKNVPIFKNKLLDFKNFDFQQSQMSEEELLQKRDQLMHGASSLLAIASGGSGLMQGSRISRLQLEMLLIDAFVKSKECLEKSIVSICESQ